MINSPSGQQSRFKVCMFLYNNFLNDSRVQKESRTLIKAGYKVTVLALLDANTLPFEERESIRIIRVPINPFHQRMIRWIKHRGQPRFRKYFKTLAQCIFVIGMIELLYHLTFYEWAIVNKIWIYTLLCLLFVGRNIIYRSLARVKRIKSNLPKRIQQFTINAPKKFLMPFHRQFCFLSFYRNAYRITNKEGFGIYHAHDLNTLPGAYFCAKRDCAKLVYDSHELYTDRNKLKPSSASWKFILSRIEGYLVNQADAVFTVNTTLARELAKRYKIPVPGVVMNTPNSFKNSGQRFQGNGRLRTELSVPPDKKLLLYVGAITFNRGLEELILSLKYLPDCYLAFMGYGHDTFKQYLLDIVEKSRIADRFSFFGPVQSDLVIHYATGADLGVAPIANTCLSYYCCSPNKLFEYMNAGIPVVASNFPELQKVVIGHDIGLTFDPADPQDIARAIRQILDDPKTMDQMSNNAVKASRLYNWENESKKLLSIYGKLRFK